MEKHTIMFGFNSNERRIAKLNRTQEGFTHLGKLSITEIVERYSEEIAIEQCGMGLLASYGKLYYEIKEEEKTKKYIQDVENDPSGHLRNQMLSFLQQKLYLSDTEKFSSILEAWLIHIEYWDYYLNIPKAKTPFECYTIATESVLRNDFPKNEFVKGILIGDKNLAIAPNSFMEKACDTMDKIVKDNIINKKSIRYRGGRYAQNEKDKKDFTSMNQDIRDFINVMNITIPEKIFGM